MPAESDLWRVAALTAMEADELAALFAGDPAAAAPWVAAAAGCGIVTGQLRYGRMLLAGEGVPQDRGHAFRCFEEAAQTGDAEALNMLGRCHEGGWGTAQDFTLAAGCYARAAEAGHAWAQYNLGHLLLDGDGVERDQTAAHHWYLEAAAQGHARAMNLVARCCEQGWGTPRDGAAARDWYRRSAEAGYFRGAFNHATLLAGDGRIAEAVMWFRRALETAPGSTRATMRAALASHGEATIRALAVPDADAMAEPA